jgi:hypothetical protein
MKISSEKRKTDDIKKVKTYLLGLGFVCNSHPSSQNLVYSKNMDIIIIKNNKEGIEKC